jgi:hypothetical protein
MSRKKVVILAVFSAALSIVMVAPVFYFTIYAPSYTTLLNTAIRSGNILALNVVLTFPGDKDRNNEMPLMEFWGATPIGAAIDEGNPAMVHLLLERGADVNNPHAYGSPPLGLACRSGSENRYETIRILVEYGADLNGHSENSFKTPLSNTFYHSYWYDTAYGNDLSKDEKAQLREKDRTINYQVMLYLIEQGADLTHPLTKGELLSLAADDGCIPAIEYLLATGLFDVNGYPESPGGPLSRVFFNGDVEVAQYLLERGADPLVVRSDGKTVLDSAREQLASRKESFPDNPREYERMEPVLELYEEYAQKVNSKENGS